MRLGVPQTQTFRLGFSYFELHGQFVAGQMVTDISSRTIRCTDKWSHEQIVAGSMLQSFIVEKICASPTVFAESHSEKGRKTIHIFSRFTKASTITLEEFFYESLSDPLNEITVWVVLQMLSNRSIVNIYFS